MNDPRGVVSVQAGGKPYRLHLGMSVLAEVQAKHGQDALQRLEPPPGAGPAWMPPMQIVVDLIAGSLRRYHAEEIEADPFLVDDIVAENQGAFSDLMAAAFPDPGPAKAKAGNVKGPKRAA